MALGLLLLAMALTKGRSPDQTPLPRQSTDTFVLIGALPEGRH
jgi:hypothetical protein